MATDIEMDEKTFKQHLCVTRCNCAKVQFDYFSQKLEETGMGDVHYCGGPQNMPTVKNIVMFLWYLANENSFRELSDKFDISQGPAHKAFMEVLEITCLLASSFITWLTEYEKQISAAVFRRICGIVGSINGCQIKIQRPPVRGGYYLNRKSFYSILLQGIVDEGT